MIEIKNLRKSFQDNTVLNEINLIIPDGISMVIVGCSGCGKTVLLKTIIGLIVPDIRSGYAPELARGAEDEAAKNKHSLILCNSDDLYVKAEFHANRLLENSVAGLIFMPTAAPDEQNKKIIDKFMRVNIPVVLADRTIPDLDIDYVTTNNIDGAYEITKYLIDNGHKKSTGLGNYLKENGIQKIYIVGLATDYCVKFSALDARKLGFDTYLVKDGTRAVNLNPDDFDLALKEMELAGVNVLQSTDILN